MESETMPTSGQVAVVLADVVDQPLGTVNAVGQALRGAELLSKRGRGRSGAELSGADIAAWLIGLLGAGTISAAPGAVKHYQQLKYHIGMSNARRSNFAERNPVLASRFSFYKQDTCVDAVVGLLKDIRAGAYDFEPTNPPSSQHVNAKLSMARFGVFAIDVTYTERTTLTRPTQPRTEKISMVFDRYWDMSPDKEFVSDDGYLTTHVELQPETLEIPDTEYVAIVNRVGLWKLASLIPESEL